MGGRGSSSGAAARGGGGGGDFGNGGAPQLNQDLVRRANDASFAVDAGSATQREYTRNINEINSLNLSETEKSNAIKTVHELTENQLQAEARAVSPYTSGRARINTSQVQQRTDSAASARQKVNNYMQELRNTSRKNAKKQETANLGNVLQNAMSSGALEVSFGGKTYYRSRKNSKTWNVR